MASEATPQTMMKTTAILLFLHDMILLFLHDMILDMTGIDMTEIDMILYHLSVGDGNPVHAPHT